MNGLKFVHRLSLGLVVFLFGLICFFGVLNEFAWTSKHINNFFTIPATTDAPETDTLIKELFLTPTSESTRNFHFLGLLLVLIVIVAGIIRFRRAILLQRGSAIKIEEEGGSTAVLESAINQYLHAVLKNIDGVESTDTVVTTSPGGAVTAEITATTYSIKPRRELTEDIRRIAKEALVNDLGIPQIAAINIVHQDYRFIEKTPSDKPTSPAVFGSTETTEEKPRLGWFGRRTASTVEPAKPSETEPAEDAGEDKSLSEENSDEEVAVTEELGSEPSPEAAANDQDYSLTIEENAAQVEDAAQEEDNSEEDAEEEDNKLEKN